MFKRIVVAITPALLAGSLVACQPMTHLISTAATQGAGKAQPPAAFITSNPEGQIRLLYATTREPEVAAGTSWYGGSVSKELRLGVATLNVDEAGMGTREPHTLPLLAGAWDRPLARLENLDEQAVFGPGADLDVVSPDIERFFSEIDRALTAAPDKDVFVYVHGGMNSFYRTVAQAAQYRQLTDRGSVVVAFVWPTVDNFWFYVRDVQSARQSVPAFARFIELLARHTQARHINILAHSAGTRIVSPALASLGKAAAGPALESLRKRLRLGEVCYAAADLEIKDFVRDLTHYIDLPLRVTLQANRDDPILALLGAFPGSSRVGRLNLDELKPPERDSLAHWATESRLDIVDVTSERGGNLMARGHAFWFERRWVSSDVLLEFMYHVPAQARGLQQEDKDGVKRWEFPKDYEERVAAAVLRLSRL